MSGELAGSRLGDDAPMLAGSWTVVRVDGKLPADGAAPSLSFGADSYSGGTGCNSLQGYFLAHARRLFATPPIATEMGCGGAVGAQERRVLELIAAGPRIAQAGDRRLALVDRKGRLLLQRASTSSGGAAEARALAEPFEPSLRVELLHFDGSPLKLHYTEPDSSLRLIGERWEASVRGAPLSGTWRRRSAEIHLSTDPQTVAPKDDRLMRMFNGPTRLLVMNSDIILAGDEHWLIGRRSRSPPSRRR
jgi:heat shock protein HslJ